MMVKEGIRFAIEGVFPQLEQKVIERAATGKREGKIF
ncbi:MAG: hypothetical protein CM1200mP28_07920 [Deltaproteobacteria bacterium]|nr:MAG: hypothetical protein CM1200mP28_07920 [Deltaproteobacteria bacterium]